MQEIKNSEMVGRCTEFCPMEEKRMRTKERLLHRLECGPGLEPVKEFSRPAAGQRAPTSANIRTLQTLRNCTRHLLRTVLASGLDSSLPLTDLYDFIFDRLRAVRQDLTLQQAEDIQILAACVRFHLLFGHLLELQSPELYSSHLNLSHQLDCVKACLLIGESSKSNWGRTTGNIERNMEVVNKGGLNAEEEDIRGKEREEMGAQEKEEIEEMGAIYLLSNLDSPSALAWALLQPLSPIIRSCRAISTAFLQGNYVRFFKLVQHLSPTLALATSRHCTMMAKRAVKVASWGYSAKTARFPLQVFERLLWTKQAGQLCKLMGQTVDQGAVKWNKTDLVEIDTQATASQSETLVSTHHGELGRLLEEINFPDLLLKGWQDVSPES